MADEDVIGRIWHVTLNNVPHIVYVTAANPLVNIYYGIAYSPVCLSPYTMFYKDRWHKDMYECSKEEWMLTVMKGRYV